MLINLTCSCKSDHLLHVSLLKYPLLSLSLSHTHTHTLSFMTRKLYALVSGKCAAESADSPSNQEILLGGHFYLMVLKVS